MCQNKSRAVDGPMAALPKSSPSLSLSEEQLIPLTHTERDREREREGGRWGSVNHVTAMLQEAHRAYNSGLYLEALGYCESLYEIDAFRTDNLLLLGAIHFQLRHFSESIFYNQQCLHVDPGFAESYSNLGNSLKELGDLKAAAQFYLKVQPFNITEYFYCVMLSVL